MSPKETIFLVADDDSDARETVKNYLNTLEGVRILEVKDGEEALAILKCNKVDFIICDWEMPNRDGLSVLKAIKADQKLKNIPFVMITSPISNEKMKVKDAGASGADAYIIKPFRRRTLMQKIQDVLFEKEWDSRKSVVVVDDDSQVRSFLVDALIQFGLGPIHPAENGKRGLELLSAHISEVALVISDWQMPEMTGIDLLRKVRTTQSLQHVPFIMATSQTAQEHQKLQLAIESDVDHYLMKPFRLSDLKAKVDYVLEKAKAAEMRKRALANGQEAIDERDPVEAEKIFESVLQDDPKNIDAHLGLASMELLKEPKKGFEPAVKLIQKAIRINPRSERSHLKLAEAYELAMAMEKAIEHLRSSLAFCDTSAEIHFKLAKLLIRRGRYEDGVAELERTVELDPQHQGARELLALDSDSGGPKKA